MNLLLQRLCSAISVLFGNSVAYSHRSYCFHRLSFSQEGEDGVLERIFDRKTSGFYIDVGSHHPQRFSNTYRFYLRGWMGINIDPLPGSKARFDSLRTRDINLQVGISNSSGVLNYYSFKEPAFNTFDPGIAARRESPLVSIEQIQVIPLVDLLDQYLYPNQKIDFMTVDVEGLDLQVLRSNDWNRYRPTYVLAEAIGMCDVEHVLNSEIHAYMASKEYSLFAKCVNTLFFVDVTASDS